MHDGRRQRLRQVGGEPRADLLDLRQLARLVDLPELREAAHLALQVAAGARERRELVARDVGGVDLDERVDEVEAERVARLFGLEARRQFARDHVPVDVAHHVERARRARSRPRRPRGCRRAVRSRRRGSRSAARPRAPCRAPSAAAVGVGAGEARTARRRARSGSVKFEPPPSPIRVATTGPAPRPCASRNASTFSSTISGGLSAIAAMLRTVRRRLYLMRHAEVSYVGERDPEVVRLTERGLEQAAAAHRALDDVAFDLVVTSGLPRTLETAAVVVPEREPEQWPAFAEWRGGRLDDVPLDELEELFVGSLQVRDEAARFLGGESLGEALDRVLPAFDELVGARVADGPRRVPRRREPDPALAGAGRRSHLLRHVRAGAGVHQRARSRRRRHLDRPDGQLHPVRPAPSRRARRRWSTCGRS